MMSSKEQTYNDILNAKAATEYFEDPTEKMLPQREAPAYKEVPATALAVASIKQFSTKYRNDHPTASERNVRRAAERHFKNKKW